MNNNLADAAGAQTRFRRAAKRRPSALRHPRRPCSSTQTQIIRSPGAKRKHSTICLEASINCGWGAKRSRSALVGGRQPSLSARSPPDPNNSGSSSTCTRDWANLGDGPAGLIAELALARDVAYYVRFRAVCRPWRQCSPDPRAAGGLDARFLPRRWIMLDKPLAVAGPCHHRFLNVSTRECIQIDLRPEVSEHRFLAVTPEGLLLLFHEPTEIGRLLNPLTRQLIDLPSMAVFVVEDEDCDEPEEEQGGPLVHEVGLTEDCCIVAVFDYPTRLAFAKPGDDSWTVVNQPNIYSALPFAGRFYCATNRGVMVLNTTSDEQQQQPRLVIVADLNKSFRFFLMIHRLHLVDNGGELMLVLRTPGQGQGFRKYKFYRVDLEAGILIRVKHLNGRALFMGKLRSISVSVEALPYVTADTIYLGYEFDSFTEEYNIADGSRYNRISNTVSVCPETIVKSLIRYCIKGNVDHPV